MEQLPLRMEQLTLRDWRRRRLMTQADLAKVAGMGIGTVARIERDEVQPRVTTLARICRALAIGPEQLIWEQGKPAGGADERIEGRAA